MKAIITLVHGTWASDAAWTTPASPLCAALRRKLIEINTEVEFHNYVWSGSNSVRAREEAARSLTQSIRQDAYVSPTAAHFLIAHSHGGNIVLDAIRADPVAGTLSGIVTLSTPFVSCRRSGVPLIAATVGAAVGFIVGFVLSGCVCALFFMALSWLWQRADPSGFIRWPALLLMLWLVAALKPFLTLPLKITANFFGRAWEWAGSWQDEVLYRFDRRLKIPIPMLCIRFGLDEALIALSTSRFLVQPLRFLTGIAAWTIAAAELLLLLTMALQVIIPFGMIAGLLTAAWDFVFRTHITQSIDSIPQIGKSLFILGVPPLGTGFLAWLIVGYFLISMTIGHWGGIIDQVLVNFRITAAPEGALTTIKTYWFPLLHTNLRHSLSYSDPTAIADISDWVVARVLELKNSSA